VKSSTAVFLDGQHCSSFLYLKHAFRRQNSVSVSNRKIVTFILMKYKNREATQEFILAKTKKHDVMSRSVGTI
jgi:hypothetical protein